MSNCEICEEPLDAVWVEIGETRHVTCTTSECAHGEPRGSRFCALCRNKNNKRELVKVGRL